MSQNEVSRTPENSDFRMPKKGSHVKKAARTKRQRQWPALAQYNPMYKKLSVDAVRFFKRSMLDATVYNSGGIAPVTFLDYTGATSNWVTGGSIAADNNSQATGMQFGVGVAISFNNIPSFTDFTNLFRQVAILRCLVKIEPMQGDSAGGNLGSGPQLLSVVSYENLCTNAVAPSYLNAITYSNHRQHLVTAEKPLVRKFNLRPAVQMYSSAIGTTYATTNQEMLWLDSISGISTQFYGPQFWFRNFPNTAGAIPGFRMLCDVWMACRTPY